MTPNPVTAIPGVVPSDAWVSSAWTSTPALRELYVRGDDLDEQLLKEAIESAGYRLDDAYPQGVVNRPST